MCSNTEDCAKKLSQILANNIDNGGRGIGLIINVRYCLKSEKKNNRYLEKPGIIFSLNSLLLMSWICQMVSLLIGSLWSLWPSKNWSVKITRRYNGFLSLKVNILNIHSVLFSWYACYSAGVSWSFFMEYIIKVVRKVNNTDQTISYTPCCL